MRKEDRERKAKRCVKAALLILSLIIISSLLSHSSLAIGITPSRRMVNFKPGQQMTYGIDIVNNGRESLEVVLYLRGEFKDNVKLSTQLLELDSDEASERVNVEFTMPDSVDVAGPHTVEIVAVGSEKMPEGEGAVVKADLAVISKLVIDVPYPDKYAEARIHIYDTESGKPVTMSIPVFNKGSETLQDVHAEIDVFSSDGTKIDHITTGHRSLMPGESTKFAVQATKEYFPGDYEALATVKYDGQQLDVKTDFNVGHIAVDIKNLVVDEFILGEVAKFDILLHNTWSTEMKNVFAEVEISGQDNTVYTQFKTVAIDIPPQGIGSLEGYWYTQGVEPGVYTAKVTLHYANRISQKEFELEVYANRIITRGMKTGKAIEVPEELNLEKNAFLILILLVMAAVITVLVLKLRKKRKFRPGNEQPQAGPARPDKDAGRESGYKAPKQDIPAEQIEQLQKQIDALKAKARTGSAGDSESQDEKGQEERGDKGG